MNYLMNKRKYNLDFMRIILSLFVIYIHTYQYFGIENELVRTLIQEVVISCDCLFYMISGYFNLEKEFNNNNDIKKYYKDKFIYILFPYLTFMLVWTIWDYIHVVGGFDFIKILTIYYEEILDTSANGNNWFMYPLFGLLLSTPFLSKMLHKMDEKELKILWYIAIGYNVIYYYLCLYQGIGFSISQWLLDGWVLCYFLGYYYRHVISKENSVKWFVLAIGGYVFTVLGECGYLHFFKYFFDANTTQPAYILFCIGLFMFFDKVIKVENDILKKIIIFISKNIYMIYLFHLRSVEYVVRKLSINEENILNGLIILFGSYIISLLLAYISNLCYKPFQKLLDRLIVIKE